MTGYIGLSLCERGLRAVAVRKRRRHTQVLGCAERSWPSSCLRPDFRELNAIEEESFMATVRDALQSLGVRKGPLALSLSDAVGKMLITTLDKPLKRGREGINLLKWQLREQLLLDPEEIRLAFQVIGTDPEGKTRVLVAAARITVLEQYENLLAAVGTAPGFVLFDSLNLMHFYHSRGILGGDHLLISRACATLTLHLYREGQLRACRCRPAPTGERLLFQEVSRTLAAWERTWPEAATLPAYLHETTGVDSWREALQGALGRVPQVPPTPPMGLAPGCGGGQRFGPDYFAAMGGAKRLFHPFGF